MDLQLEGAVALVCASTQGLGYAVANRLVQEGAWVAICGRDQGRLDDAVTALSRASGNGQVSGYRVDVRSREAVYEWVRSVGEAHGRIDIVVANCGGVPMGPATQQSELDYRHACDSVLLPQINIVQAALPYVRVCGAGRIQFITSEAMLRTPPHFALSSVARAGLVPFARVLAQELGPDGTTVNVLAPGAHETAIHQANRTGPYQQSVRAMEDRIPLQKIGRSDDFATLSAYLASRSAGFISGVVVPVDGGLSASA